MNSQVLHTSPTAVVALGGNAISSANEPDTIANQFRHTREALAGVAELVRRNYRLAVTHGNGPQVGNALLRVELSKDRAPVLPLGVIVADTEGGMGYMIEQCLQNVLLRRGLDREVFTVITQVCVDPHDPALTNPTKFIGQYYDEAHAKQLSTSEGWTLKPDGTRGWRRVVGSPKPLAILNAKPIAHLVKHGTIVIAAGGGGIPVYAEKDGWLEGVDAVIDKDRASAVLARDIGARELFILTEPEYVSINFGRSSEERLPRLTLSEAKRYLAEGHFPPGSMGPKIEAAITFLESGGNRVIVCALSKFVESLDGKSGTVIVPN